MKLVNYYDQHVGEEGEVEYSTKTNLPLPSEIRERWCFGLPLSKDDGTVMSDEDIMQYLRGAVRQVERELGIYLKPTVIKTDPYARGLNEGEDYDVEEPPYDYDARAYSQYGFLQLRQRPVQQLLSFKMVLPNGNTIIDFMRDENTKKWIKLYKESGQLHIVPY